jgi:hypothetical protein
MTSCRIYRSLRFAAYTVLMGLFFCAGLAAQGPAPDSPTPTNQPPLTQLTLAQPMAIQPAATRPAGAMFTTTKTPIGEHKFWDKTNTLLFAATAAGAGADFAVTRANLQQGGQELNPVVRIFGRSDAGLAVNFAGETAGVIALSYFFHRTGHHQLERLVSVVNIGGSVGAVSYGLAHR